MKFFTSNCQSRSTARGGSLIVGNEQFQTLLIKLLLSEAEKTNALDIYCAAMKRLGMFVLMVAIELCEGLLLLRQIQQV